MAVAAEDLMLGWSTDTPLSTQAMYSTRAEGDSLAVKVTCGSGGKELLQGVLALLRLAFVT